MGVGEFYNKMACSRRRTVLGLGASGVESKCHAHSRTFHGSLLVSHCFYMPVAGVRIRLWRIVLA